MEFISAFSFFENRIESTKCYKIFTKQIDRENIFTASETRFLSNTDTKPTT